LLLIIFFTFLTGYALFSGKIKTCGCFGDCLPLTPAQSFGKDIGLLVLITLLFAQSKKIKSALSAPAAFVLLLLVTMGTAGGQGYVLKHLPFVDCLPYKKGNNLLEQMKTPAGAIPDSFSIVFTYIKGGKTIEFDQSHFPTDFDSTYEYVDRKDKLARKGNGLQAKILDMSFQTLSGTDTTQQVLNSAGKYIMIFAKEFSEWQRWADAYAQVKQVAVSQHLPVLIVTADADAAVKLFTDVPVVKCDGTVIKSAARAVPTFFFMDGALIKEKKSAADISAFLSVVKP
jgi:hypothetical protein